MKSLSKLLLILPIILMLLTMTIYAQNNISSNVNTTELTRYFYDGQWHDYNVPPTYLQVNGEKVDFDVPPVIMQDYTLIPARAVFGNLGANITWDEKKSLVGISLKGIDIELIINNDIAIVNGQSKTMSLPAKNINSRTMIPVRFVAETLGMDVDWDGPQRLVSITYIKDKLEEGKKQEKKDIYIQKIYYSLQGENLKIVINADKEIEKYTILKLTDPDRTAINIENSILDLPTKPLPVYTNTGNILQIRFSQFDIEPNITRIVIDMDKWQEHDIQLGPDEKELIIYYSVSPDNNNDNNNDNNDNNDNNENDFKWPVEILNKVVVIDPGHGGNDPGATYGKELLEKDINLDISLRFYELLKESGIKAYMTRYDDKYVGLTERTTFANNLEASLFISIHNNALEDNDTVNGTMTYYYSDKFDPKYGISAPKAAAIVQEELLKHLSTPDRKVRQENFAVLRTSKMPAVLAEIEFVTSPEGRKNLQDDNFRQSAAQALYDATIRILEESI